MAEPGLTIEIGGLCFNVRYSQVGADHGPSLRIYGEMDGQTSQLLRFDCFEHEPHFHYDPQGKNNQLLLDKANIEDPITWAMDHMQGNITSLVRIAGYSTLADQLDENVLTAALPTVEKALRDSIPAAAVAAGGITASGLRFSVDYLQAANGGGPSLQILGDVNDESVQLLRFDCFENEPHFHYDPNGKNNKIYLNTVKVTDPIDWTIDYLRENITSLVRIAGYGGLADQLDETTLSAVLPGVEKALRDCAPRD